MDQSIVAAYEKNRTGFLLKCAFAMVLGYLIGRAFSMIGENRDFMMEESCRRAHLSAVVSQLDDGAQAHLHYDAQGRTPDQIKALPQCKEAFGD